MICINTSQALELAERTRSSTHFLGTFILTCNPNISVNGPNILTQSFLSGVIRCGGMGILRLSDFNADLPATLADMGGKDGADDVGNGSVLMIISSSS